MQCQKVRILNKNDLLILTLIKLLYQDFFSIFLKNNFKKLQVNKKE